MIKNTSGQDEIIVKDVFFKKKTVFILLTILILFFTMFLTSEQLVQSDDDVSKIKYLPVIYGTIEESISVSGTVIVGATPQIFSPENGFVKFHVEAGEQVEKNQVIGEVISDSLIEELKEAKLELKRLQISKRKGELINDKTNLDLSKQLQQAKSKFSATKREFERAELALNKKLISEVDYLSKKDQYEDMIVEVSFAEKEFELDVLMTSLNLDEFDNLILSQNNKIEILKNRVNKLRFLSPSVGYVGSLFFKNGDSVKENESLITIVDLSEYEISLKVPEIYSIKLQSGQSVTIELDGKIIQSEISNISPQIIAGMISVKVKIANTKLGKLRQNQRITAKIVLNRYDDVLYVNSHNVYLDNGKIEILTESGKIFRNVDMFKGDANNTIFRKGVAKGNSIRVLN